MIKKFLFFTVFFLILFVSYPFPTLAQNKYVTILYEVWFDAIRNSGYRWENRIITGPPYPTGWAFWGLSDTTDSGWYISSDPQVINKHADQLSQMGIDFISLDFSNGNGVNDPRSSAPTKILIEEYIKRIKNNQPTPKIAFFQKYNPQEDNNSNFIQEIYKETKNNYGDDIFKQLFFHYDNKPLLLTHIDQALKDSLWTNYFTIKIIKGLTNDQNWSFLNTTDQLKEKCAPQGGWCEEMAVAPAFQNHYMSDSSATGRRNGQTFNEQWNQVYKKNPTFVFIKSWNEWAAINLGTPQSPRFTDVFSPEYSIDLEPMKGGFKDQYYQQAKEKISLFKSVSPDLYLYNSSTGQWQIKFGDKHPELENNNYNLTFNWSSGNYQPLTGDFNADGYTDIGLRNTKTGQIHLAYSDQKQHYHHNHNFNWQSGSKYQSFTGDFNTDGYTDIGLRNTSTGLWSFAYNDKNNAFVPSFDFTWTPGENYTPLVGSFDPDQYPDIALWEQSTGKILIALGNKNNTFHHQHTFTWLSGSKYQAFTGNFDTDLLTDLGIRNTSNGEIYLALNKGSGNFNHLYTYQSTYTGKKYESVSHLPLSSIPPSPTIPPTSVCSTCPQSKPSKSTGNSNCDSKIDLIDFNIWLQIYKKIFNNQSLTSEELSSVDFNCQPTDLKNTVNLQDFSIWLNSYQQTL